MKDPASQLSAEAGSFSLSPDRASSPPLPERRRPVEFRYDRFVRATSSSRVVPPWLAVIGAMSIGALTATQARINGQLGARIDDGMLAAFLSFSSGLVVLILISCILPSGRAGWARLRQGRRTQQIPLWMLFGGVAGALTVATQGVAVGVIGVSLFTVGIVAGQASCGLVLDRIGFGPAGVVAVTPARLIGGALALAAIAVPLSGDTLSRVPLWMLVLPFLAGAGIAWQTATNGRLNLHTGNPATATLVNFIGGTLVLTIAAGISVVIVGVPERLPSEPWLYIGGVLGVIYIMTAAALVRFTGVLLLGLGTVVGQLLTSFLIDLLWPTESAPGMTTSLIMIGLGLCSVLAAIIPWGRFFTRRS